MACYLAVVKTNEIWDSTSLTAGLPLVTKHTLAQEIPLRLLIIFPRDREDGVEEQE